MWYIHAHGKVCIFIGTIVAPPTQTFLRRSLNSVIMTGCVLFQGAASLHNNEKNQGDEEKWPVSSTHAFRMTPTTGQSEKMYSICITVF